ncbi:MAG: ABC transporter substrate-binding protein [Clostridia bacterium]|nr:ABC transporter substrate-binding protein [Clostridia bacterium]
MKKVLALVLALIMVLSFAACGKKETPSAGPEVQAPKVLNVAHKGDPLGVCHLNVMFSSIGGPLFIPMYDCLLDYNTETKELLPMLATKWEIIDDTHYRFTLRDDVTDWSGQYKMTAKDVMYTMEWGFNEPKLANYYSALKLDECKVEDDTHIVLATKAPTPFFLYNLANRATGIVIQAAVEAAGSKEDQTLKATGGTGPYKFVEWVQGSYVKLAKNENYWGKDVYYDEIVYKIITDASARVIALESGDVDIALEPAVSQAKQVEANPDLQVISLPTAQGTYLYFYCKSGPFSDVNVRRAASLAINYEANLKIAMGGFGTLTDSYLVKNNIDYVSPQEGNYTSYMHFDLDEAKKYMAMSSYPNGGDVEILFPEGGGYSACATLLQQQLAEIGLNLKLTPLASSVFYDTVAGEHYNIEFTNGANPDPAIQTRYFDHRLAFTVILGGTGWKGPEGFDELVDAANVETDPVKSKEIYAQIQKIVNEDACAAVTWSPNTTVFARKDLKGAGLEFFGGIVLQGFYE